MSQYLDGLDKTEYVPNVVIYFAGVYFTQRTPDSGLVVDPRYNGLISRIAVNPTSIDPLRPTTTINTSAFTLINKDKEVSKLFVAQDGFRTGQEVKIYLGRSYENMDFSEYLELPAAQMKSFQLVESNYNFTVIESKDRLNNGAFNIKSKLAVDILAGTTTIQLLSVTGLPSAGYGKIGDEFISWSSITDNDLGGCIRGEFGTTAAAHDAGADIFNAYQVNATNGIDLLAQILISGGGGGSYDVLPEGVGFPESLIDIDQFEAFRDEFFADFDLSFMLWGIESLQSFLEEEIYRPLGVRLRTNNNGKIGLAVLNRNIFDLDAKVIDETITTKVNFSVSDDKVSNRIRVYWDWSDGKNLFQKAFEQEDADSIARYGVKPFYEVSFKGVKDQSIVESFCNLFLARFAQARPEISVETFNSSSYLLVGDKTELVSSRIPTTDGAEIFISTLEVLKKSYNPQTGIVAYQLSFTSFSGLRQCFIAPSDIVVNWIDAKTCEISTGRGSYYRAGWKMRLYSGLTRDHVGSQVNEIASVVGDVVTFVDEWSDEFLALATESGDIITTEDDEVIMTDTILPNVYRIKFADYNEVNEQQKKFCFISDGSNAFADGKKPYQITFS